MPAALLSADALRQRFVETATAKFARNVPDFVALQDMVRENGGTFRNDHGAIRTADPHVRNLFVRAAAVLGLKKELNYKFPAKKLKSFDLQVAGEDAEQFKIFVSQVDLEAFPREVARLMGRGRGGAGCVREPQAFHRPDRESGKRQGSVRIRCR